MPLNARVGVSFFTNAPEWKKSISEMKRYMEKELGSAKVKAPKIQPPSGNGSTGGKGGSKNDPLGYSQIKAAMANAKAAEEKQAKELDKIRGSLRAKTAREEKKLVDNLVNEQARLQARTKVLNNAIDSEHNAATKKILARERQKVREISRLNDQALKERREVQRGGAGSKVGILGTGRNLIGGEGMGMLGGIGGKAGLIGVGIAGLTAFASGMQTVIEKGATLEKQMASLSAITGLQGEKLREAGLDARELGVKWNIAATEVVQAEKLIISQLGPDIAKHREQLKSVTDTTLEFAKASEIDAATATETLTVTISEFGFANADAATKAKQMHRASQLIAKAAQEGAAEADDLGKSMREAGATANSLGVSMEQTASLIELIAPSGLKAERGGVAVRNILLKMSAGSKEANEALADMGITFHDINPQNVGITKGLENLRDGFAKLKDPVERANAIQRLFGLENANAAQFLMDNANQLDAFTAKITDSTAATQMAATNMNTMSERWGRFGKRLEEVALTIFDKMTPGLNQLLDGMEKGIPALMKFAEGVGSIATAFVDYMNWQQGVNDSIREIGKSISDTFDDISYTLTSRERPGVVVGSSTTRGISRTPTAVNWEEETKKMQGYYAELGKKERAKVTRRTPSGKGGKGRKGGGKSADAELSQQMAAVEDYIAYQEDKFQFLFDALDDYDKEKAEKLKTEHEQELELEQEFQQKTAEIEKSWQDFRFEQQKKAAEDREELIKQEAESAKDFIGGLLQGRNQIQANYERENEAIAESLRKREITQIEATKRRKANEEKFHADKLALAEKYDALEFVLQKFGLTRDLEQLALAKGAELAIWIATESGKTAATEAGVFTRIGLKLEEMWVDIKAAAVALYDAAASFIQMSVALGPFGILAAAGGITAIYGLWEGAKALFAPRREELAAGGLVRAKSGGINAIIGEGGSDEIVMPLNSKTMRLFAESFIAELGKDSKRDGGEKIGTFNKPPFNDSVNLRELADTHTALESIKQKKEDAVRVRELEDTHTTLERYMKSPNLLSDINSQIGGAMLTGQIIQNNNRTRTIIEKEVVIADAYGFVLAEAKAKNKRNRNNF